MDELTEAEIKMADALGEEVQRADIAAAQIEAPWDVAEVPHTISADERAMLCQASDGISWPADTAEAFMCEWLEEHGLLSKTGTGDARVWKPTKAGRKLASHIHERNEALEVEKQPDFSQIVRTDEEAEAYASLMRRGLQS